MIWAAALLVFALGCQGGVLNAILSDGGLLPPTWVVLKSERRIWKPGWVGNAAIGGFSAFIMWGIYGPLTQYSLFSGKPIEITLGQLAGAALTGVGGSRILTSEIDKRIAQAVSDELKQTVLNETDDIRSDLDTPSNPNPEIDGEPPK